MLPVNVNIYAHDKCLPNKYFKIALNGTDWNNTIF